MAKEYVHKRPAPDPCPVEEVLHLAAGKWKVRILYLLFLSPRRFSQLQQRLNQVSQQKLSEQLAALVRDNIIEKSSASNEKKTLYALTEDGRALVELLMPVCEWGEKRLLARGVRWVRSVFSASEQTFAPE